MDVNGTGGGGWRVSAFTRRAHWFRELSSRRSACGHMTSGELTIPYASEADCRSCEAAWERARE